MITFSQVGTSDLENYGDLLYPIVLARLLERRGGRASAQPMSLLGGTAPQNAGFASTPVRRLFERGAEPWRVVVGGGDLLRVDWDVIADHYRSGARRDRLALPRMLGCVGALRHVVRGGFFRATAHADFLARFRARVMSYPAPGPFILDPDDLPVGSSTYYLSVGVPYEISGPERPRVARALDRARFVWLRDEQSRDKLRRAGVTGPLHVAPDLVVVLGDLFARDDEARRGRALLAARGVDVTRPILCFQCQAARHDEAEIVERLRRHQDATGAEIVLLPLGPCHGDDDLSRRLVAGAGGHFRYAGVCAVRDALAVIAASDLFVGTSLHGNITAFSFGMPHLIAPLCVDKTSGFLEVVGAPREQRLTSWSDLNDRLAWIAGYDRRQLAERAADATARVYRAVDALLAELLRER